MKTKLLILSAIVASACVSCGQNGASESSIGTGTGSYGELSESSASEEITENSTAEEASEASTDTESSYDDPAAETTAPPKVIDRINTVDEKMTDKGNMLAYEVHVKKYDKDGECSEYTEVKSCFDKTLLVDGDTYSRYEYKYNSDGLVLEYRGMERGDSIEYEYDDRGNPVRTLSYAGREYILWTQKKYRNEYDTSGTLISCTVTEAPFRTSELSEGIDHIIEYKYDENGNLTEEWEDGSLKTFYSYDERGNVIVREEHPNYTDSVHRYVIEYDSDDMPVKEGLFISGELMVRWEYEYEFYD